MTFNKKIFLLLALYSMGVIALFNGWTNEPIYTSFIPPLDGALDTKIIYGFYICITLSPLIYLAAFLIFRSKK
ncbi:MAG: hypothetical protein COV52_05365 [Gammaproteobacteria bacterium CG11_big_fil_rev_8_21_14_0_20_46_22]|nr:MAG: hypothetical protein COV52_05365 [Gammaproteobacteria bacterium CG11_big_fil_rev_8_21_14_0_20_46_22]